MNLRINLKEDEDIRREIKEMIKEQVLSIIRDEMRLIVAELIKAKADKEVVDIIDSRIIKIIKDSIGQEAGGYSSYRVDGYVTKRFNETIIQYVHELLEPIIKK